MERKSRWFAFIVFEAELDAFEYLRFAREAGAEIYRHEGERPHWHCLLFSAKPVQLGMMKRRFGRVADDSFIAISKPDATRRYMRNGGVKV